MLTLVRAFAEAGKPVCAMCHGPQVLISAARNPLDLPVVMPALAEMLVGSPIPG